MSKYLVCESFYKSTTFEIKRHLDKACLPIFETMWIEERTFVEPSKDITKWRRELIRELEERFLTEYRNQIPCFKEDPSTKLFNIPDNVFFKVYVSITPLNDNRTQGVYPPSIVPQVRNNNDIVRIYKNHDFNAPVRDEMTNWYNKSHKRPLRSE